MESDLVTSQSRMLRDHLRARGIREEGILAAFAKVPREAFVSEEVRARAYDDCPLPLDHGQTISQPFIVALAAQALAVRAHDRVLEIGTGSGYAAAIFAHLGHEVHTVERIDSLARSAAARLRELGFDNVHVHQGDGSLGWPGAAPFDAICVSAGGPRVPAAFLGQLAIGGRLVMPVGPQAENQMLIRVVREGESSFREEPIMLVRFVPLIGADAHREEDQPATP